ncbi:hypothetical protein PHYSODRAFT_295167 [Phytophthora sojae]|uniref:SMP-30/Gluconolactonase/LRE-like region domain-containing protein n=1 Tax=Phytophthora sojae (strain P6497) TaxID=1094619 RepID=G4YLG5_PHYSP|nr:hypothetical protein PHYSODRAFT_295167 [Phytophthora sojae]EGZ30339.1 hypothetical protein PHYSODRAFT_295167 [Phytophthora sojae]|eukprot:XP_009517614.1 hypothetical protein PHYSODRAFT_295167 [Phytophthora sojae]
MSVLAGYQYWVSGYADGYGDAVFFKKPRSLAVGSDADLYVADVGNYYIRKVRLTTKEVTTYAGTCTSSGATDGVATSALFQRINLVYERDSMSASDQHVRKIYGSNLSSTTSIDSSTSSRLSSSSSTKSSSAEGNPIFLSDGSRILQMSDDGELTLYAGSGDDMNDVDGVLLDARFNSISSLAMSSSGDLFACDYYKVSKISGNTVSTLYTDPSPLSFHGIAVDSIGNVYVTDYYNGKITKITSKGVSSTFSTSLSNPSGIVTDSSDNIYVTDNNRVMKFTSGGAMTVLAGSTSSGLVDGTGTSARFYHPDALAIGSDGDLYVADKANYCIRRLNLITKEVTTSVASGPFEVIWGMAAAADNVLYVRDRYSASVQRVLKVYTA